MKQKKLVALLLAMAMVLSMALTGCGGSDEGSGDAKSGDSKTLVIAIQDEIEGTDIQQIGWENVAQALIYSPLVTFNADLTEIEPCFAESYEVSEDGLDITFHLYEDSKFSNGDPLTAESVKASVERMKEISEYSGDVEPIEEVEVIDETTFVYHLSQPAPFMWASLTSTYGGIVDVSAAEEMGNDEFNRCAVTNGPYMVKEWQAGSQLILEKNPNFKTSDPSVKNKGILNFDQIILRFIPDEFTRVSELEAGNVDIIYDVPASSVASLKENSDLTVHEYKQSGVTWLRINTDVVSDPKVREAIAYGLNRDAIVDTLNGTVAPAYSYLTESQAGFSPEKEAEFAGKYAFDLEKAKSILKDAGYEDKDGDGIVEKDGKKLSFEFASPTDKAAAKTAIPVIQQQFLDMGIEVNIKELEAQYIKQTVREGKDQLSTGTYVWNDADILYYIFTEESGYPWHNAKVTKGLEDARYEIDAQKRIDKYAEVADQLIELRPGIPLYAEMYAIACRNNVKGLIVTNDGRTIFNDATKE